MSEQAMDPQEALEHAHHAAHENDPFTIRASLSIAVMAVKRRTGDFTDVLLGAKCVRAGCTHTVTFDKRASRMRGFASVPGKGIGMN